MLKMLANVKKNKSFIAKIAISNTKNGGMRHEN